MNQTLTKEKGVVYRDWLLPILLTKYEELPGKNLNSLRQEAPSAVGLHSPLGDDKKSKQAATDK